MNGTMDDFKVAEAAKFGAEAIRMAKAIFKMVDMEIDERRPDHPERKYTEEILVVSINKIVIAEYNLRRVPDKE